MTFDIDKINSTKIKRAYAEQLKNGKRIMAELEDGTTGVLVKKTTRVLNVVAIHSKVAKTRATESFELAAFATCHTCAAAASTAVSKWKADDTILQVVEIERETAEELEEKKLQDAYQRGEQWAVDAMVERRIHGHVGDAPDSEEE